MHGFRAQSLQKVAELPTSYYRSLWEGHRDGNIFSGLFLGGRWLGVQPSRLPN